MRPAARRGEMFRDPRATVQERSRACLFAVHSAEGRARGSRAGRLVPRLAPWPDSHEAVCERAVEGRRAAGEHDPSGLVIDLNQFLERDLESSPPEPALGDEQRYRSSVLVAPPSVQDADGAIRCVDEVMEHPVECVTAS